MPASRITLRVASHVSDYPDRIEAKAPKDGRAPKILPNSEQQADPVNAESTHLDCKIQAASNFWPSRERITDVWFGVETPRAAD
jgi:hypothetical protein